MTYSDELMHEGVKRRSGRYPWGSGKNPYQHSGDFLSRVEELKSQNYSFTDENGRVYGGNTAIAKYLGMSTSQFRTQLSLAKGERRSVQVTTAKDLRDKGYTLQEIADQMGFKNDSSVRALLNDDAKARANAAKDTAEFLKEQVKAKGMLDVGTGVERELGGVAHELGISKEKLDQALTMLEMEGYEVYNGRIEQVTNPGKWTTLKVLAPPGTEYKEIYDYDNIHSVRDYTSPDGGDTFNPTWVYPKSMDSKRLQIKYAEEGGIDKDGVVEIRRNVDDLSLGNSAYSQVRILVDNSHYIKGMAVYADDLPDGVDVRFNTNKKLGTPMKEVLKKIKTEDPNNPFGSLIKEGINDPDDPFSKNGGQSYYYDKDGNKQLSLINKRADEGDWNDWSNKLPSQFLSKQSVALAKQQLDLAKAEKRAEFDEIMSLTNPTVKKVMLDTFANDCDSAAEHLKAAALPRQAYKVILPLPSLKDNEVYAPHLNEGEQVALIRYPHGGQFEIPILTVNNRNKEGQRVLGKTPADAIGINKTNADRLSGADFDGDTVMAIPIGGKSNIKNQKPLAGLADFDTKVNYGPDSSEPVKVDPKTGAEYYQRGGKTYTRMRNTQTEMGKISNLITDMTLKGAPPEDLAKAVRHSMVVIDAEKHKLDYKQSYIDNDVATLREIYQGHTDPDGVRRYGASTLISRASSEVQVNKRVGSPKINQKGKPWYDPNRPEGSLIYKSVEETYKDPKTGKTRVRTQTSTRMAETDDARTLISEYDSKHERLYADYANSMKAMANNARKEMVYTPSLKYNASAAKAYKPEVDKLMADLNVALKNAPRERQAQIMANSIVRGVKQENPDIAKGELKKIRQQSLTKSRNKVGAHRTTITITDREWEAIQAGAVSENQLLKILNNTNVDEIRSRATPRTHGNELSTAKVNNIKALKNSGYTMAEIAQKLGVSTTTVNKYVHE